LVISFPSPAIKAEKEIQTMSHHKRLSRLSLATVALLAAALPCLAQTESSKARDTQADAHALSQPTAVAVLGNERLAVHKGESKTASEAKVIEKETGLSRAKFLHSIAQATSVTPSFLANPTTISESNWEKTLRLSNDNESTSPKRITFVPSRGQRLPQ